MDYFLFADIYRAKVSDKDLRSFFKMAMEDIGHENIYLGKYSGSTTSANTPTSKDIKRDIFHSEDGRGYLYRFSLDEDESLTDKQISLLKSTLVMNTMGIVDVKNFKEMDTIEFKILKLKRFIDNNKGIISTLDWKYPLLKFYDFNKRANVYKIVDEIDPKKQKATYRTYEEIQLYYKVKRAQIDMQNILCNL